MSALQRQVCEAIQQHVRSLIAWQRQQTAAAGREQAAAQQQRRARQQQRGVTAAAAPAVAPLDQPRPQLLTFVTGGAGVGKSFLIKLLCEFLQRAYTGRQNSPIVLTAPTGVAAFNIAGNTLHSALKLPVEHFRNTGRARVSYRPLNGRQVAELRARWLGVEWLEIDEISMVSSMVHPHAVDGDHG